jgi:hypothetical protein
MSPFPFTSKAVDPKNAFLSVSTLLEALHMILSAPGAFQQCNEPVGVIKGAVQQLITVQQKPCPMQQASVTSCRRLNSSGLLRCVVWYVVRIAELLSSGSVSPRRTAAPEGFFGLTDSVNEGTNTRTTDHRQPLHKVR